MATTSFPILDRKWGYEDTWESKFVEDVERLEPSQNSKDLGELMLGFFYYYWHTFDWAKHAVCVRLNSTRVVIDKFSLPTATSAEQWYVEALHYQYGAHSYQFRFCWPKRP